MNSAKLYCHSGEVREISPLNGSEFTLEELQGFVGGYIEIVSLDDDTIMCVNEDGKFLSSCQPNRLATEIAHSHNAIMEEDYICGCALVCPARMIR